MGTYISISISISITCIFLQVDYAFIGSQTYVATNLQRVSGAPVLPCAKHGPATMTRKVNMEFLNWWNEALIGLKATAQYKTICMDLEEEHGKFKSRSSLL